MSHQQTPASRDGQPKSVSARITEFESEAEARNQFVRGLENAIRESLRAHGVEVESVKGRVKSTHSFARHLARSPTSARREDLTALRVVVLYSSEMEPAVEALKILFGSDEGTFRDESDKIGDLDPWEFAYRSHHLKFKPASACDLEHPVPDCVKGEWLEVQVRTLAAHVWGAIDHKLRYKTPFPLSNDELRTLFRVAAQLESVDRELDSIRVSLRERATSEGLAVLAGRYSYPLSLQGVRAMVFGDPDVVRGLAMATTYGWRLLSRDGHEHQEGGELNSPAEKGERDACDDLCRTAASARIESMADLRARAIELLADGGAIRALVTEGSARGLDPAGFPADLISLLLRATQPIPPAQQFAQWQDTIDAIRAQHPTAGEG